MLRIIFTLIFSIMAITGCSTERLSDDIARESVLLLINKDKGLCTGTQIYYKGHFIVLTAAHCSGLLDKENMVTAVDPHGRMFPLHLISISPDYDLMALSSFPLMSGLEIAYKSHIYEHIRIISHGEGHAAFKTEGELLEVIKISIIGNAIPFNPKMTKKDLELFCPVSTSKKFRLGITESPFVGIFVIKSYVCYLDEIVQETQAMVVPGSSGASAIDDAGRIVGIVSAGNSHFGSLVPLKHIREFLDKIVKG